MSLNGDDVQSPEIERQDGLGEVERGEARGGVELAAEGGEAGLSENGECFGVACDKFGVASQADVLSELEGCPLDDSRDHPEGRSGVGQRDFVGIPKMLESFLSLGKK